MLKPQQHLKAFHPIYSKTGQSGKNIMMLASASSHTPSSLEPLSQFPCKQIQSILEPGWRGAPGTLESTPNLVYGVQIY